MSRNGIRTLQGALLAGVLALSSSPSVGQEAPAVGDADAGERFFIQCKTCHVFDPDARRQGPHLLGLWGRVAGSVDGARYSDAMLESGIVWTDETLGPYLLNPREALPGTTMLIGLRREEDLADLLAYMRRESAGGE